MCLTLQSILHVVLSSYAHAEENVILLVAKALVQLHFGATILHQT